MMRALPGVQLKRLPVSGLTRVRDLAHFAGPLITEYAHPLGDRYLFYWCDCDESADRWMVLRVSESNILRLEHKIFTLDQVIPDAGQDDFVYFVDEDKALDLAACPASLTLKASIPDDYRPAKGAFLRARKSKTDKGIYPILLDGQWSMHDLGEFPKKLYDSYALIYCLKAMDQNPENDKPAEKQKFRSLPWCGGYSSVHFFKRAMDRVPVKQRPQVAAVHYESPGFMKFRMDEQIAEEVRRCVSNVNDNAKFFHDTSAKLEAYLKTHELNDPKKENTEDWEKHDPFLLEMTKALISGFSPLDTDSFISAMPRPFEAAKVALMFYRRVNTLCRFQRDGLVTFPNP